MQTPNYLQFLVESNKAWGIPEESETWFEEGDNRLCCNAAEKVGVLFIIFLEKIFKNSEKQ